MVCQWGMSDLGPISFGSDDEVFLGRDFAKMRDFSDETASAVDREVHRILEEAYKEAKEILTENKDVLVALSERLYEKETLEAWEIDEIIREHGKGHLLPDEGKQPPRPEPKAAEAGKPGKPEEKEEERGMPGLPGDATPDLA